MRTLVLVLGTTARPYPDLIRAQKRTWAARDVRDVDVLFFYGGADVGFHGRDLYVAANDDFWSIGHKTLAAFEQILAHRTFDLVFRTNCSSYTDLPNLRTWVDTHARATRYYAGLVQAPLGVPYRDDVLSARLEATGRLDELKRTPQLGDGAIPLPTWSYASGACYFLSRDLVEWTVEHRSSWDHDLPDDMALGRLLAGYGVAPESTPRQVVDTPWDPRTLDTSNFHYRCRTASSWRRGDIDAMLRVDALLAAERGETTAPWFTRRRRLKLMLRSAQAGIRARRKR